MMVFRNPFVFWITVILAAIITVLLSLFWSGWVLVIAALVSAGGVLYSIHKSMKDMGPDKREGR